MGKLLIAVLVLFFMGCAPKVEYVVSGTAGSVDLTYSNQSGNSEQLSGVSLPWTYEFDGASGDFLYISAQNNGRSGSVVCDIYVNEKLIETSTSSGAYVIATASGSI